MEIETYDFSPRFCVRKNDNVWYRLENEPPFENRNLAFDRKWQLKEEANSAGEIPNFRAIKHKGKYYLYKKK